MTISPVPALLISSGDVSVFKDILSIHVEIVSESLKYMFVYLAHSTSIEQSIP